MPASATHWRRSVLIRETSRALAGSALAAQVERVPALGRSVLTALLLAFTTSRVAEAIRELDGAAATSGLVWLATDAEHVARHSFLVRWFTAEPEPQVVVIDLRDTFSIGPVIALIDRLVRFLLPASHYSAAVEATEATADAVENAPVRAASLVLLVAVIVNLALALAVGEPNQVGVIARVVLLALAALGTRIEVPWHQLVETRPVRLVIAALEPPEPPDDRTQ